jgi:uncharacterized protein YdcH (DUF465 family)
MEDYERARIEALIGEDEHLRRLWTAHQQLESRLAELDALPHLTPAEELERKRIQKQKLAGKDRMAEIVSKYRA